MVLFHQYMSSVHGRGAKSKSMQGAVSHLIQVSNQGLGILGLYIAGLSLSIGLLTKIII